MLLAIIAVAPFTIAEAGQLMANVIPVFLGILLSALVLLGAGRFPVCAISRNRRPVTGGLGLRCSPATRDLLSRATLVMATMRSAARIRYTQVQQYMEQPSRWIDADIRWQLAGGLWLFIGGLLLTGFILSI
jgi:hypothetical protein